jgi:hypothetical protein
MTFDMEAEEMLRQVRTFRAEIAMAEEIEASRSAVMRARMSEEVESAKRRGEAQKSREDMLDDRHRRWRTKNEEALHATATEFTGGLRRLAAAETSLLAVLHQLEGTGDCAREHSPRRRHTAGGRGYVDRAGGYGPEQGNGISLQSHFRQFGLGTQGNVSPPRSLSVSPSSFALPPRVGTAWAAQPAAAPSFSPQLARSRTVSSGTDHRPTMRAPPRVGRRAPGAFGGEFPSPFTPAMQLLARGSATANSTAAQIEEARRAESERIRAHGTARRYNMADSSSTAAAQHIQYQLASLEQQQQDQRQRELPHWLGDSPKAISPTAPPTSAPAKAHTQADQAHRGHTSSPPHNLQPKQPKGWARVRAARGQEQGGQGKRSPTRDQIRANDPNTAAPPRRDHGQVEPLRLHPEVREGSHGLAPGAVRGWFGSDIEHIHPERDPHSANSSPLASWTTIASPRSIPNER